MRYIFKKSFSKNRCLKGGGVLYLGQYYITVKSELIKYFIYCFWQWAIFYKKIRCCFCKILIDELLMSNKCSEVKSTIFPSKLFWSINIIIKLSTSNSHLFSTCKCTWYRCDYFLAILSLCHESGQITDASPTNLHGPYDFITEWHVQAWLGVQGFHSMQQVQNWSRCGDMRAGTQNWWNKSKGKKKKSITTRQDNKFNNITIRAYQ